MANLFHTCLYLLFDCVSAVFGWWCDFMDMFGAWQYYIYIVILFAFVRFVALPHFANDAGSDRLSREKINK